ncbi:MAG: hypothetical protein ACRBN8_44475 [Nannocystales bacterium]
MEWVLRALALGCVLAVAPADAGAQPTSVPSKGPMRLAVHRPLDDVDPRRSPSPWLETTPLTLVAAAGERERAAFVVYAGAEQGTLDVQRPALGSPAHELPATVTSLRRVRRVPVRRQFLGSETEVVGRFAPKFVPHAVESGTFEEVWLEVDVPAATPPGVYAGELEVQLGKTTLRRPVRVRVREMSLATSGDKHLGMYYRMHRRLGDAPRVRRELADMREHGVDTLVLDVRPRFGWGPGHVAAVDTDPIEAALVLTREAGFHGTVVVDSGLVALAQMLGHTDVAYANAQGASLDADTVFAEAATRTLDAIADLQERFAEQDVVVMHVDEIFDRGRLPLFERLAPFAAAAGLRTHATLSTADPSFDRARARIDPLVDVRSHHGYSFEWWLLRGGTVTEYRQELHDSGDTAWFYHNERGSYFTGRWARLVNGLYLWASPFEAHITWAYQSFDGKPLDDRDGRSHDFGMAFPDPDDPDVLMPTRIWTALSEGHDDLRYLAALQSAIARLGARAPEVAQRAQAYLDGLRRDVMRIPGGVDVDRLSAKIGTPAEAPFIDALAGRYDDAALALMRSRVEEHIHALEVASMGVP